VRVTFVVPRYGTEIIGGAETAARLLAEHLVAQQGWEVEVLATCAADFVTWEDHYPPGVETVNGVTVRRFVSAHGREPSFHPCSARLLADPEHAPLADAEEWLDLQGPVSPDLVAAATSASPDAFVFYPYLYHPTVRVIGLVDRPAILHPAAHDEPALRLPIFPAVFAAADALVFQTAAERSLVQQLFPVATTLQLHLGLGVDEPGDHPGTPGGSACVPDAPYLLCLGRVDRHKGAHLLASLFAAYKERRPGPLRLVLAGPVVDAPPPHPDIDLLGPVDEAAKWQLLAHALALVSPSPWEAFSLVVAEAWSAGRPVVVHAGCAATVEHCRRSGGGLAFGGFGQFEAAIDRLAGDAAFASLLGARGLAYVEDRFRWPAVVDRYARFVEIVAGRGGLRRRPSSGLRGQAAPPTRRQDARDRARHRAAAAGE
jgi:glycosyltransferase involved in cell wall biosynthesis